MPYTPAVALGSDRLYVAAAAVVERFTDVYLTERVGGVWTGHMNVSRSDAPSSRPVIIEDAGGMLHMVWGERTRPTPETLARPNAVVYANRTAGAWSTPEVLFEHPDSLRTILVPRSVVRGVASGDLHMAFSAADSTTTRPTVLHLRRSGGSWSQPVRVVDGLYPDLARTGDGRLVMAYIAPVMDQGASDVNSVFVVSSADDGATWPDTALVRRSGTTPAFDVRVTVSPNGTIHLLWFQNRTGGLTPEAILHSYSQDGIVWSPARTVVDRPGSYQSFDVAADRYNRVHLVYHLAGGSAFPAPPYRAWYQQWNGMAWSGPEVLHDWTEVGFQVAMTTGPLDTLYVATNVRDYGIRNALVLATGHPERP